MWGKKHIGPHGKTAPPRVGRCAPKKATISLGARNLRGGQQNCAPQCQKGASRDAGKGISADMQSRVQADLRPVAPSDTKNQRCVKGQRKEFGQLVCVCARRGLPFWTLETPHPLPPSFPSSFHSYGLCRRSMGKSLPKNIPAHFRLQNGCDTFHVFLARYSGVEAQLLKSEKDASWWRLGHFSRMFLAA